MALVNDGNLLQHFVECELVERLGGADRGMALTCTHAMAPREGPPASHAEEMVSNRIIRRLLGGLKDPRSDEPRVVSAYRMADATTDQYPNTAALLREIVGRDGLTGVLCETKRKNQRELDGEWSGTDVRVHKGSWRAALKQGLLEAPDDLAVPWLFSMDPYTYHVEGAADDGHLYPEDLREAEGALGTWLTSDQPGAIAIFAYKVVRRCKKAFEEDVRSLAERLGATVTIIEQARRNNPPHVAAILAPAGSELPRSVKHAWDTWWAEQGRRA